MGSTTGLTSTHRCDLQHPFFGTVGDVVFRRSPVDGVPTLAMRLGGRDASIPLRSLQRELDIGDDTEDGRMLDLIHDSLDFVDGLRPGDLLPAEILTGEASWQPPPRQVRIAATRLRLRVVAWFSAQPRWSTQPADDDSLLDLADDPALREEAGAVAAQAAGAFRQPGATTVLRLIEELGQEMAYIDTLRVRLQRPIEAVAVQLSTMAAQIGQAACSKDTAQRVERLLRLGYKPIRNRFDDVDAQTADLAALVSNAGSQQSFIRSNRDWLYRSQRVWAPLLSDWSTAGDTDGPARAALLTRSYQFLASRFMPSTEWTIHRRDRVREARVARMTW